MTATTARKWLAGLLGLPLLVLLPALVAVLAWPALILVLALDLLASPVVLLLRRRHQARPRDVSAASIIVVSWNGRHFLEHLLPTLKAAVAEHGGDHEVIVVDNGSTDGSPEWLAAEWPWVKVVALPENRYFVRGNMAGVTAATRDVLVFLNNDMEVQPGFLAPLLEGLQDPRVCGVTAQVFFKDPKKRREETGRTRGELRQGALKLAHVLPSADETDLPYAPTFWAGGGSSAFDRRLFLEFGGFDPLYDPFYLEDTGLSYQAWKRGFALLFTARSKVLHEHRGTSRKVFGDDFVDGTIRRNQHLFVWRNITDPLWTAASWALLPLQVLAHSRPGRSRTAGLWFETRAFLRALPRLPLALLKRCADRRRAARSDRSVFRTANSVTAGRRLAALPLGSLQAPDPDGLRILVLAARLPRVGVDGSWILFERLVRLGRTHRVTLFAFGEQPTEGEAAAAPLRAAGIRVELAPRERNPLPGNWHGLVPHRLFRDYSAPAMERALIRMLEGTDCDVVQVEYIEMAHLLHRVRAALPPRTPLIYTCHESLALAARRELAAVRGVLPSLAHARRLAVALRHERRLLAPFREIIALSSDEAAWLAPWLRRTLQVVPSGVNAATFAPGPDATEDPATILFVGYFGHAPNLDAALWLCNTVLPLVRAQVPEARVELVGRDAPASLELLARGDGVTLRGYVADLAAALHGATVVAMPLRTGGGMRGKVLEAWAACRPVVATSIALEGFASADGVHCLCADDAEDFAAALVQCLRDADLRRRLGNAGQALVRERYSSEAMAVGFEAIYRRLVGEEAGR